MCHEQWALAVIKSLRFFVLIFIAEVLLGRDYPRVVPIGPIVYKRSYSISNIGNMMGCDHPSCLPVGPFAGEL